MGYYIKSSSTTLLRQVDKHVFFGLKTLFNSCEEVEFNDVAPRFKVLYIPNHIFHIVNNYLNSILLFEDL